MNTLDDDIDRLYQLPLAEFTKARDALAKVAVTATAAVRALQKPNVPAWAVNQLYWRERRTYDALVAAASKLRAAHLASLQGTPSDIGVAQARHDEVRRTAVDLILRLLRQAGEAESPATLHAISDTLEALPTDDRPGRLVRPLKPMGLAGFASLLESGKVSLREAEVVPFRKLAKLATEGRQQARQEQQKAAAELREARDAERLSLAVQAKARRALDRAKACRTEAAQALEVATAAVATAVRVVADADRDASAASSARVAAQARLEALNSVSGSG